MPLSVSDVGGATAANQQRIDGKGQGLEELSGNDFLQLLITELTSQDPFDPMTNQELLEQLSGIRSLEADMGLTESIKTLVTHQEMSSAATMIGRYVVGADDQGVSVEGVVEALVLDKSGIRLQIGQRLIPLTSIEIVGPEVVAVPSDGSSGESAEGAEEAV